MRVSVAPDPAHPAGHALIRIDGAASSGAGVVFSLSRPDWAECNLGPGGWQIAEASLTPDRVTAEAGALILAVGPAVCDHMENGVYVVAVPSLGLEASVQWPEIVPEYGGRSTYFAPSRTIASDAAARSRNAVRKPPADTIVADVAKEPAKDEAWIGDTVIGPKIEPKPELVPPLVDPLSDIVPPPPPSRGWIWIVLAVVLAGCAGGGVYAWLHWPLTVVTPPPKPIPPVPPGPTPPGPTPPGPTPPGPTPPTPEPAVDLDHMSVVDLAKRNKPAEMVDQARKRLAAKPGESMLLLEAAGDDLHDGAALTLLAQLYDPNKPRQGGIPADPRQAARYYRDAAARGDASGAADREALHRMITQRKDAGDVSAKLIEQDFWP